MWRLPIYMLSASFLGGVMSYLLALLVLGAIAFIAVLYRRRLAPQDLLCKVARRFGDQMQTFDDAWRRDGRT